MEETIRKALEGDKAAFTKLMTEVWLPDLYKIAWAILYKEEDVLDAVQETILTCWEKRIEIREAAYFKTWTVRVLINECRRQLKDRARWSAEEKLPDSSGWEEPFREVEWIQTLRTLEEGYREVLLLYYLEGLNTREIAKALELSESAVRQRLARGRKALARSLQEGKRIKRIF